jgi:hypothetical protein
MPEAGAHHIIDSIGELPALIGFIICVFFLSETQIFTYICRSYKIKRYGLSLKQLPGY